MSILDQNNLHIREVWKHNLDDEIALIRDVVDRYPYVAMDTEFPGIVLRPLGNASDHGYQALKANTDVLKLIQLGLTFADEKGNLPTCGTEKYCVWQINFCEFNLKEDPYAEDSIELLTKSGVDFRKNNEKGVSALRFGELLMSSGAVLNDEMHWVTFHSSYDFGYLLKLLTGKNLPDTEAEFFDLMEIFFPNYYDIKHLMKFCNLYGGLNKVAELLGVQRLGISHQAGSDSLLTCCTFMKLIQLHFHGASLKKYAGVLYGLGSEYS